MTTAQAIDAVFASELSAIDEAATKAAQKVERERAKLTRSDGSPVYSPAEQAEQVKAIYAAAAAEFDQVTARYIEHADRERVKAEAALAELSGDAFDRLSAPGQAKAAARREFVKEDCETLPVFELAPLARASIAAGDKVMCYLYRRYLGPRLKASTNRVDSVELNALVTELGTVVDDPKEDEKRQQLERRIAAAKSLKWKPSTARLRFDGSREPFADQVRKMFR